MTEFETDYQAWVAKYDCLCEADRLAMCAHIERLPRSAMILLAPLVREDDAPSMWLPVLEAIRFQTYPYWQVAWPQEWANISADLVETGRCLDVPLPSPETTSERRNFLAKTIASPSSAEADFVVLLPPGTLLDERALYEFAVASTATPELAVLYADEDQIGSISRKRHTPRFKTTFDSELMLGRDALGLPVAYNRSLLIELGGLREGVGPVGVALYDLALRASELVQPDRLRHIPLVLCHRYLPAGSTPEWNAAAAREVVRHHFNRVGEAGVLVHPALLAPSWSRVERPLPMPQPLVSIIVPTRDNAELLARCADAILHRTDYTAIELLIVDNGSAMPDALALLAKLESNDRVKVLRCPGPFNYSALNNTAARDARGEILLLLNNDTDVLAPDWLREMVTQALRPDVGAVGAKLLYADGRIQHAGVVLGDGPMIAHQLRLTDGADPGPMGELALTRTVLAVTGACLAIRRAVFFAVGGLDEANFAVAFNDIDLCLRLADHGYRNVWTPFAELLHLESASRGDDGVDATRRARLDRELATFSRRWSSDMQNDPFHNVNIVYGWNGTGYSAPPRRTPSWAAAATGGGAPALTLS